MVRLRADDGSEPLVGVRTNDADAVDVLRDRLGPLIADDEEFRFPNIRIQFGRRRGHMTDTHIVFRRGVQAFHTFSRDQAIDAAMAQLHTFLPHPDGLTPLQVRALERNGSVVLVSDAFASALDAHHRRLEAAGYSLLPHIPVLVDAAASEALLPRASDPVAPALARVPISHLVAFALAQDADIPTSVGLLQLKALVSGAYGRLRGADLQRLATLTATVPVVRIDSGESRRVVRTLVDL